MTNMPLPSPGRPQVPAIRELVGDVLRCDWPLDGLLPGVAVLAARDGDGVWTLRQNGRVAGTVAPAAARTRVFPTEVVVKETPSWAKVLGVIGIVFFLLGLLFFLVKEERRIPAAVVEVTDVDGRVLALQVRDEPNRLRYGIGAE